jgi:VWFA-related protein
MWTPVSRHAYDRVAARQRMPGVFEVGTNLSIGRAIDDLLLIATTKSLNADSRRTPLVRILVAPSLRSYSCTWGGHMLPRSWSRGLSVIVIGIVLAAVPESGSSQSVERVVYVSALNRSGRAVDSLSPKDIVVRENNITRNVLRISRVAESFDIAVMVDTSQAAEPFVSDFRQALTDFFRAMGDRHQIALIGFGQRPAVLVNYTNDPRRLQDGLSRVFAQSGSGAYLMEALIEVSQDLRRRENSRRVAIVISTDSAEFGDRYAREVVGDVLASDLVLDAFVVTAKSGVARANEPVAPRVGATPFPFPALPDQNATERAAALDEAAKLTGGRLEHIDTSMVLGSRLRELASEFNNQYRITYEGSRPTAISRSSIQVQATRGDLRIRAMWSPPY